LTVFPSGAEYRGESRTVDTLHSQRDERWITMEKFGKFMLFLILCGVVVVVGSLDEVCAILNLVSPKKTCIFASLF
jgi:hypothetical protein